MIGQKAPIQFKYKEKEIDAFKYNGKPIYITKTLWFLFLKQQSSRGKQMVSNVKCCLLLCKLCTLFSDTIFRYC